MASINQIKASDGSGNAQIATVQSSRSGGSSTIIVDTVSGIPANFMASMGTPHTFTDPITYETITVISEATAVDFSGHVDGSNLEIDDIAPGYVDGGSEVGDIVIIRPTTQWGDNVADVLGVSHEDDGTLKDDVVDTDQIVDGAVETAQIGAAAVTPEKRTGGYKIGNITAATLASTGNKAITGVGFIPKIVRFRMLGSAGATTGHFSGDGGMTPTNQFATAYGGNTSDIVRFSSLTLCLAAFTALTDATPELQASYVSMDADGFTINVSVAASVGGNGFEYIAEG